MVIKLLTKNKILNFPYSVQPFLFVNHLFSEAHLNVGPSCGASKPFRLLMEDPWHPRWVV